MSQTNTNTNNGSGNTNRNQLTGRSGWGRGGFGGRGHGDCSNNCGNNSIAKYLFEGRMKDGCISKLTITETGHWVTQYKKIIDNLPVLCANKNYRCIDDVFFTGTDLVEADFIPPYPDSDLWSNTYDVEITTVDQTAAPLANGERPPIIRLEQ